MFDVRFQLLAASHESHVSSSSSFSSSIGWLGFEDEDDDENENEQVHGPNAFEKTRLP